MLKFIAAVYNEGGSEQRQNTDITVIRAKFDHAAVGRPCHCRCHGTF